MSLIPPEHRRIIPHMEISEQGLRELEIWLLDKIQTIINGIMRSGIFYDIRNRGGFLSIETTGQSNLGWNNNPGLVLVVGADSPSTGAGDFLLVTGRDWNIDNVGRDINMENDRDINVSPGRDINTVGGQDYNYDPGRDFNVFSANSVDISASNVVSVEAAGADGLGFGIDLTADAGIRLAAHGGTIGLEFGNYNAIQNGGSGDYNITCGSYLLNSQDLALIGAGGEIDVTAGGTFTSGNVTVALAIGETLTVNNHLGNLIFKVIETGGITTSPPVSAASTLALGTAYQNTLGYDVMLLVVLNITVNTTGVIKLGVGPTNTPTQQTIATGVTSTGFLTVPIYLPNGYYALLSSTGTITLTIAGQNAMPV